MKTTRKNGCKRPQYSLPACYTFISQIEHFCDAELVVMEIPNTNIETESNPVSSEKPCKDSISFSSLTLSCLFVLILNPRIVILNVKIYLSAPLITWLISI